VIFPQISSKPPSPQETEHRKKRRKKEKKKKEKKLQESPQIKGEVNILRGEKHFNFKDPF
jgi:ribosomal protein S12